MSTEHCVVCAQSLVLNIAEEIGGHHVGTKIIRVWELQHYPSAQVLSRLCFNCGIQYQDDYVDTLIAMQSMRR